MFGKEDWASQVVTLKQLEPFREGAVELFLSLDLLRNQNGRMTSQTVEDLFALFEIRKPEIDFDIVGEPE